MEDLDKKIDFFFGENNNYHQIGNAYLRYDITVRIVALSVAPGDPPNPLDPDFIDGDKFRLVSISLVCTFK